MLLLEPYELRARLAPGLLAVAPLAIAALGLGLRDVPVVSSLVAVLSACGGPLLLASTVRDRGLARQVKLVAQWGGRPTTRLLRLGSDDVDAVPPAGWRAALERLTGTTLPSLRAQSMNAEAADAALEVAVGTARERTRVQTAYPLVFAENVHYGFERNMLGIRAAGLAVAAISCVICAIVWLADGVKGAGPPLAAALDALFALMWCLPSERRVREAGFRYARQLFTSISA